MFLQGNAFLDKIRYMLSRMKPIRAYMLLQIFMYCWNLRKLLVMRKRDSRSGLPAVDNLLETSHGETTQSESSESESCESFEFSCNQSEED